MKSLTVALDTSLKVPARIDVTGRFGLLRSKVGPRLIQADDDLAALVEYLHSFQSSLHTVRAYEKDLLRFHAWACRVRLKPVSSLVNEDYAAYQAFMANPQPRDVWCSRTTSPHRRGDARWRPFKGALTPKAQRQAFIIISGFLSWLVRANYLVANPLALVRLKRQSNRSEFARSISERHLDRETWGFSLKCLSRLPKSTPRERAHYERSRFLLQAIYLLAARRAEIPTLRGRDLVRDRGNWWVYITGKGGKSERVPATAAFVNALKRYRASLGLSQLPPRGDNDPMLRSITGRPRIGSVTVYKELRRFFMFAADQALSEGKADMAATLSKVSTHWLRHSRVTHLADKQVDIHYLKRVARHSSIETTDIYIATRDEVLHEQVSRHDEPDKDPQFDEDFNVR